MRDSGALVLKLEYNSKSVHGARITLPLLAIDEHMGKMIRLDHLPAGTYDGTLTIYQTNGSEIAKPIKVRIQAGKDTVQEFDLTSMPKEVILRPVDAKSRTVLHAELRIENMDPNFRLVRDEKGLAFKLKPGEYHVKMLLPDMQVKIIPLTVTEDTLVYSLPIEEAASTRKEPRFQLSVPVAYRSHDGNWIATNSTNISSTGVCLVKGQQDMGDKEVYVRLFVPISHEPVECYAKVRWLKEDGLRTPRMGLELQLPDDKRESLSKWLERRQAPKV